MTGDRPKLSVNGIDPSASEFSAVISSEITVSGLFFNVSTDWGLSDAASVLALNSSAPQGDDNLGQSGLVGLHAVSDGTTAIAYFAIAATLLYGVQRRPDLPFRGLFWLLGAFIAVGGLTHTLAMGTLWFPPSWVSGSVKAVTALLAVVTAVAFGPRLPAVLARLNTAPLEPLHQAVAPESTEGNLAEMNDQQLDAELEGRVARRTATLTQSKQADKRLLYQAQGARAALEVALQNQQDTAERLKIALSAAQMGTWDWRLSDEALHWSPKTISILGFDQRADEVSYDSWRQCVHPEDLARVEGAIAHAQSSHAIFSEEYRVQWPDQSWHWVLAQGRFLYANDQPHQMIGVIQETTEEKRAILALAASEARFRAVFEQAAVGMARLSPAGLWLQVNNTLCTLLGYASAELIDQPFQQFTEPADLAQDQDYYQQLVAGQIDVCRFQKRYRHKDGTPIWTMVTVSTETDEQGNLLSFIAVIEDIRGLKQTTAELKQRADELERVNSLLAVTNAMVENRNAELDQFAYVTSHDLKAPLRAIANLSEWLEEDLGSNLPAENRQQLTLLRSRAHRMEGLINGLLEYSRVGRREQQVSWVDVRQMLLETIDLMAPPESFIIALPEQMPGLKTNRTALNQVFSNLISNAIKHHDREDGQINITATEQEQCIEFTVQDDGPGIAPQYHQKVFTIFQTLKARDDLESTGIGLAIVKKTVESAGGSITLESAPGDGSTFRFTWPRSP